MSRIQTFPALRAVFFVGVALLPVRVLGQAAPITVIPKEPVLNHPQQYEMQMTCGVLGSGSSSIEAVTTNPEADLRNQLGDLLEDNYAMHQKMKAASNG